MLVLVRLAAVYLKSQEANGPKSALCIMQLALLHSTRLLAFHFKLCDTFTSSYHGISEFSWHWQWTHFPNEHDPPRVRFTVTVTLKPAWGCMNTLYTLYLLGTWTSSFCFWRDPHLERMLIIRVHSSPAGNTCCYLSIGHGSRIFVCYYWYSPLSPRSESCKLKQTYLMNQ